MNFLKGLKEWWNNIFIPQEMPNIGLVMVDEIIPQFADSFNTSNKTVYITSNPTIEEQVFECVRLEAFYGNTKVKKILRNPLTQDGKPIKMTKNLQIITGIPLFEKNGFKPNQLYGITGLGFMGDISKEKKVILVTDQYVFFRDLNSNSTPTLYSFAELKRMERRMIKY